MTPVRLSWCTSSLSWRLQTVCVLIVDLDAHEAPQHSSSGLLLFENAPPSPTTPPNPKPPLQPRCPSPPRQRPRYPPCAPTAQCVGAGRWQRRGLGRGQMFEDPAVMRIVQGRPSLKVGRHGMLRGGWNPAA